jgi:hypothetical protein
VTRRLALERPAYNRAMRLLIANDDGYLAPGLVALVEACRGLGEIDVIAPEQNASGTSNALTLNRPLSVFEAGAGPSKGFRVVNGTPSDCVHVALTGLLEHRPDLVLSGINNGMNMGDDTLYSGTVAAGDGGASSSASPRSRSPSRTRVGPISTRPLAAPGAWSRRRSRIRRSARAAWPRGSST